VDDADRVSVGRLRQQDEMQAVVIGEAEVRHQDVGRRMEQRRARAAEIGTADHLDLRRVRAPQAVDQRGIGFRQEHMLHDDGLTRMVIRRDLSSYKIVAT